MRASISLRAEPEALHRAGPESLDQAVGGGDEVGRQGEPVRVLEVDRDAGPAARDQIEPRRHRDTEAAGGQPVDADDAGAEVGEQHGRHRPGPDARELDDAQARERALPRCGAVFLSRLHPCSHLETPAADWHIMTYS